MTEPAVFVVGAFQENCYLLHDASAGTAVLIDPGDDPIRLCSELERRAARLTAIWLTHAHLDHIGAVEGIRRAWPGVPVHLHPADAEVYDHAWRAAAMYNLPFEQPAPADRAFAEGETLTFGGESFTVWHLPGHSPGHVALIGATRLFGGDLLFQGSIGRTDLPRAEPAAMAASLERLMTLPDHLIVHPGHGPATTIGAERASNPFLTGVARIPRS